MFTRAARQHALARLSYRRDDVRLSIFLAHWGIVSKWRKLGSRKFHFLAALAAINTLQFKDP